LIKPTTLEQTKILKH